MSDDDIKITLHVLCESVSARMLEYDFVCRTVQIGIRDNELRSYERQRPMIPPNRTVRAFLGPERNHADGSGAVKPGAEK